MENINKNENSGGNLRKRSTAKTQKLAGERLSRKCFSILKHSNDVGIKVENSNVLDLYSGIGSFGISVYQEAPSQ